MVPFQAEKGQTSSTKMVSFHKRVKNPRQNGTISCQKRVIISSTKKYYFRKGSKFINKNDTISGKGSKILDKNDTISEKGHKSSTKMVTISENDQKSSTKIVPFQKRVKNLRQKWYHFRKDSKILDKKNGTISVEEKGHNSLRKRYHYRKG